MQTVTVYTLHIDEIKGKEAFLCASLPANRVDKARRFVSRDAEWLSLAAGYLISRYVGDYRIDADGKPCADGIFFNVSHSGDVAALAVSTANEVGLDIEKITDREDARLAAYCLCEGEYEAYLGGTPFLQLFTAKESLAKAEGHGLKRDVKSIPALPTDGAVVYLGRRYYRHPLALDGYLGAVTLLDEDFNIVTVAVTIS